MNLEPRAPHPSELKGLVHFLNQELRHHCDWSIQQEYPSVFSQKNLHNLTIIADDDKILSHAATTHLILKNVVGIFKAVALGSVVTNQSSRRQGYSSKVIETTLQKATASGADFAILWAEIYDFYRKLDFELAGQENNFLIEPSKLQSITSTHRVHKGANVDPAAILRLYMKHTVGAVRTLEDIREYLKIPNSNVYTLWDKSNQLKAYLVEGKGADLSKYVHEWGGDVDCILELLKHVSSEQGEISFLTGPQSQGLNRRLTDLGLVNREGFLGMIRILNPDKFFPKITRYAQALGHEEFLLEYKEGLYYFGKANQLFKTDSHADIVRLIFGPQKASQLHQFDDESKAMLEAIFPLPFWFWGWDSI